MARVFALCFLVLTQVACAAESSEPSGAQITGVIVEIDANGADFRSITVKHGSDTTEILIKKNFDYGFDLVHLFDHKAKELPVRVTIEHRNGRRYAHAIDDA